MSSTVVLTTTSSSSYMLQTDYLVVGCGAVAMAFVDTLLSESEAHITIVDRNAKPGGHWNMAYPFVTLHQPSQFYGVSSKELSGGRKDTIGWNKGLYELATGAEIQTYFEDVMSNTFLPSGRVQYYPMCNYVGDLQFESLLTGERFQVEVRKKLVDTTYLQTRIPATHQPNFTIDEGVQFMPINDLVNIKKPPAGYVIIGGGKTGIDACLWLLENGVAPENLSWIVSRDAWLLDRRNTQPTMAFFEHAIGAQANQIEAVAQASSIPDLFDRLEKAGVLLRLDQTIIPSMFHGATISQEELRQLRRIKKIVRKGRVKHIGPDSIVLNQGDIPTTPQHIHVDCSASAISNMAIKPIFGDGTITPQTVRSYQPVFSASVIAYIEAHYASDKEKNNLCQVVPLPNHDTDWLRMMAVQMVNQFTWSQDKALRHWLRANRLDGFSNMVRSVDKEDKPKMAILAKLRHNAMPAMAALQRFMTELNTVEDQPQKHVQLQVKRDMLFQSRLVALSDEDMKIQEGEMLVRIKRFAYTANNITYGVAGDQIGYWRFFPPVGADSEGWGVIPVWGFAEVIKTEVDDIAVGERIFGYFPPATHLKMRPVGIKAVRFIDGSAHRAELPAGYNMYSRVEYEPHYRPETERERMLFTPLHMTSYFIWDHLQEKEWFGAKQVIVLSASSKTSTGLAFAIQQDKGAPHLIGLTSARNLETVQQTALYDTSLSYDNIAQIDYSIPTVIVDMSGNMELLLRLHKQLADQMKFTVKVGITHWTAAMPRPGLIEDRTTFFFAPKYIQQRFKEWGTAIFEEKTSAFLAAAAQHTKQWLTFRELDGLAALHKVHATVCEGKISPNEGLIVEL